MRKLLAIIFFCLPYLGIAQNLQSLLDTWAKDYSRSDANIRPSKVDSCTIDNSKKSILVVMGGGFQEQHFTPDAVNRIYREVRTLVPSSQKDCKLTIKTDGRAIEDLVPIFYREKKKDRDRVLNHTYHGVPWVKNISRPYTADKGLEGHHVALWQSHGRYYRYDKEDWYWQRPRLFCTTEDLFSQTFVVPFIIPMLENSGAIVFTPRERDYQSHEVIIDNDQPRRQGSYIESVKGNRHKWAKTPLPGFAEYKKIYLSSDTPFSDGSARHIATTSSQKDAAVVQWIPNIPEEGRYAVYVTYQSLPRSVEDATYTVHHKGGNTVFKVNQKMGGGTWVYLGTFEFDKGEHTYGQVSLSNYSSHNGVVTADAVRFGGGMGNIIPENRPHAKPSGLPRWAEGAKYSTQWFGFPYKVHTEMFSDNDYNNDIYSRSAAVNHLMGSSIYAKDSAGLGVPIDVSVAFHTDAGVKTNDDLMGTLSVYMTDYNNGKTGAGMDRYVSRDLSSMLLTNFSRDLNKYQWAVRQLWNRNYGEARTPLTPSCILEMLSHQNFADMKMAYDPRFKFDLSRSVYKTLVKYIATLYQKDYAIQPLPVEDFHIKISDDQSSATLSWTPVNDPLEPTAKPHSYIVYTRRGYQGFDNGQIVKGTSCVIPLKKDEVYSFKISALNDGGESFPSEVLSCGISSNNKGTVMVVNAFTRLEGPAVINTATSAGFDLDADPGVPYGAYTGFCGRQKYFDRSKAGSEASDGLGMSGDELEGKLMMGNTFDYTAMHGHAILLTRKHSFTSCSEGALLHKKTSLPEYPIVDIIYGTQKEFNRETNNLIAQYFNQGGRLLVSAAHTGGPEIGGSVLATLTDRSMTNIAGASISFDIERDMNPRTFCVPSVSVLAPSGNAAAILTYSNGNCAAIAQPKKFVRLGFPLEAITDRQKFNSLTRALITYLE